jgi:hypothetical protein
MKEWMSKTKITAEEEKLTTISWVHLNASQNYFSVLSSVLECYTAG